MSSETTPDGACQVDDKLPVGSGRTRFDSSHDEISMLIFVHVRSSQTGWMTYPERCSCHDVISSFGFGFIVFLPPGLSLRVLFPQIT